MRHRLRGRLAHLLTLATPRGRFGFGCLAVMLPETRVHIGVNRSGIL